MEHPQSVATTPKRKRASRKGLPKRFDCPYLGCKKQYSRAEHLARHELNHSPKEIYHCQVDGCPNSFVRLDLFQRHQCKHEDVGGKLLSPRERESSAASQPSTYPQQDVVHAALQSPIRTPFDFSRTSYIRTGSDQATDAALLRASSDQAVDLAAWQDGGGRQTLPLSLPTPTNSTSHLVQGICHTIAIPDMSTSKADTPLDTRNNWMSNGELPAPDFAVSASVNDNFAAWLFDSPGSQHQPFDLANLPYFDFGIDYSPNFDPSFTGNGPIETQRTLSGYAEPQDQIDDAFTHLRVGGLRRDEIVVLLAGYWRRKRPPVCGTPTSIDDLLYHADSEWPNITTHMLEGCMAAFWRSVVRHMPIIHKPTFSCNNCKLPLLLSMVTLGAGQLVRESAKGARSDYRAFADLIATNLRWDIFTEDDAQPPVQLWVAQALLGLELYEKLFASRILHERAHIHHASTLTLLRRGSPMVGDSADDAPPSEAPTRATSPAVGSAFHDHMDSLSSHRWWQRWIQNESMHRVVFTAFQMDALHAVLFGHESVLLPYEVRLPLPCDDALWTAGSADEVRRLEQTFSMHGIKPIHFLDGLKRCLHGQEVQSHYDARLILVAGLLSVGWHIKRRDKHSQFLETLPVVNEQDRWRTLLFQAYGHWRRSFETALSSMKTNSKPGDGNRETVAEPTILYHMAYITSNIDIIDVQVFAGTRRLLGRKVSNKDHAAVVRRMRAWAESPASRVAVLHASQALDVTLVQGASGRMGSVAQSLGTVEYACRADPLIYRPWVIHLAALTMWSHQYAAKVISGDSYGEMPKFEATLARTTACQYVGSCALPENADRLPTLKSAHGCAALLQVLAEDFVTAESDLLQEASKRLRDCSRMLFGTSV